MPGSGRLAFAGAVLTGGRSSRHGPRQGAPGLRGSALGREGGIGAGPGRGRSGRGRRRRRRGAGRAGADLGARSRSGRGPPRWPPDRPRRPGRPRAGGRGGDRPPRAERGRGAAGWSTLWGTTTPRSGGPTGSSPSARCGGPGRSCRCCPRRSNRESGPCTGPWSASTWSRWRSRVVHYATSTLRRTWPDNVGRHVGARDHARRAGVPHRRRRAGRRPPAGRVRGGPCALRSSHPARHPA